MHHECKRHSTRLQGFDYATAASYYVTVCTHEKKCILGDIIDGDMVLTRLGRLAKDHWEAPSGRASHVRLDAFVIMPNHLHGIVVLGEGLEIEEGAARSALRAIGGRT